MPRGKECTVIKYELLAAPDKIRLDLRRSSRTDTATQSARNRTARTSAYRRTTRTASASPARAAPAASPRPRGTWSLKPLWFENLIYEQDDRIDAPSVDHLWSPGLISNELSEGDVLYVVLSQEPQNFSAKQLAAMEQEAAARFEDILEQANIPANNSAEQDMIVSSYHLVDDREECIAPIYTGYPSVDAKPRDTFIALPGLLLATGREDVALKNALSQSRRGGEERLGHAGESLRLRMRL